MTKREACLRALRSPRSPQTADVHGPINFEILTTLQHPAARSLLPADNASLRDKAIDSVVGPRLSDEEN